MKSKYKFIEESKTLSPINLEKYDSYNYFSMKIFTTIIYTKIFSKKSDLNTINKTYFNNEEYITTNESDSKNNTY